MTDLVPVSDRAPDALRPLRTAVAQLDDQRKELAEAGEYERLIYGLAALVPLLRDLRELERALKQDIAELLPEKRVEVEGVGVVERRTSTSYKGWQSEDLLREIVQSCSTVDENGELHTDPERLIAVLKQAVPFTGSLGWRVGVLRDLGFDVDEWSTSTPGPATVQIHGSTK